MNATKLRLFPLQSIPADAAKLSLDERAALFIEANPQVVAELARMARDLKAQGRRRVGIKALVEVLRWRWMMQTDDPTSEYRINNSYTSRLARHIEAECPDLAGIFETRALAAERAA